MTNDVSLKNLSPDKITLINSDKKSSIKKLKKSLEFPSNPAYFHTLQ